MGVRLAARRAGWLLAVSVWAAPAVAGYLRDIVFDCPCSAEWVAGERGETGTLTVTGGIRSLRAVESGEVSLAVVGSEVSVGALAARGRATGRWSFAHAAPGAGEFVALSLYEQTAQGSAANHGHFHETLTLWPEPGGASTGPMRFVDILTDTDGDGVGDVNERLAGTSWEDPESVPGASVVDVLALYTDAFGEAESGYPYTRLLHVLAVANAIFQDSGTNIRLRTVGMQEIPLEDDGWASRDAWRDAMEGHGADLSVQYSIDGPCNNSGGCAGVGAARNSRWKEVKAWDRSGSALTTTHELGHVMGLAHSARQGESDGAWRWSRGHYVTPLGQIHRDGTVMTYGANVLGGVFSDPGADCGSGPCGVPGNELDGADAVASLDRLRFQVAAHRAPAADTDGDGIVDASDAEPEDPNDWFDVDGDGIGDNADSDDDNDGIPDIDDAFPLDPGEWSDADRDGIGDNADDEVVDLTPFRDTALRAAVESALGKPAGAPITPEDMVSLTGLTAQYAGIRDLAGLELATRLEKLVLDGNEIVDLSPVSDLGNLKRLSLYGNRVRDVAPLSRLTALETLNLAYNPIDDISSLSGLENLWRLQLGNTGVIFEDVSRLPYFDSLRSLDLSGLGIDNADLMEIGKLQLGYLYLANNAVSDLSPLSRMSTLRVLNLSYNDIVEIEPLAPMEELTQLQLAGNQIADISAVSGLTDLKALNLRDNDLTDVGSLAELEELTWLWLNGNRIADVSPLANLSALRFLTLRSNAVSDISSLAGLSSLESLDLTKNRIVDLPPLASLSALRSLTLEDNAVSEIDALVGMTDLERLNLGRNRIADIAPLASLSRLGGVWLYHNAVSDLGALVDDKSVFGTEAQSTYLDLDRNPLDEVSIEKHIPALRERGIDVYFPLFDGTVTPAFVVDPTLRALIAEILARARLHVDDLLAFERWPIDKLQVLRINGRGIGNLSGLESAQRLNTLHASSNRIVDLAPLAGIGSLREVDLRHNRIADLSPLVENSELGAGDWVALGGNPLDERSLNVHVPALLERGVKVRVDSVRVTLAAGGAPLRFDTEGYFEAVLGTAFATRATIDDESVATAETADSVLIVRPGPGAGTAMVTMTATGTNRATANLQFLVTVAGPWFVPLVPGASDALRQGFVRIVNHGAKAGEVRITAVDDSGWQPEPLTLAVDARAAVHFNSRDLERGNPAKGLKGSTGTGSGDWRLEISSALDIDVLAYVRTPDGFLTSMHDVVPITADVHRVPTFNPASNRNQVSRLRLVNRGTETLQARITGVDDAGISPGSDVALDIPAGAAVLLSAADLEGGGTTLRGALGEPEGKWRLRILSEGELAVINLLESPEGHLANLSNPAPAALSVGGVHLVPLFPSASDAASRQGFVRIVNDSTSSGTVRIRPYDDTGQAYEALTLTLDAGEVVNFSSDDLELGNPSKGLTGSTGPGAGDWRLEISSDLGIQVLAFIRTPTGFLTAMHDVVVGTGRHQVVQTFNPASNTAQASSLRIVNAGSRPAHVSVGGIDDSGAWAEDVAWFNVGAGEARSVSAYEFETGFGLRGALGDGAGKWRLKVDSEQPILLMNLLESPTGHLANLSTTLTDGQADGSR